MRLSDTKWFQCHEQLLGWANVNTDFVGIYDDTMAPFDRYGCHRIVGELIKYEYEWWKEVEYGETEVKAPLCATGIA